MKFSIAAAALAIPAAMGAAVPPAIEEGRFQASQIVGGETANAGDFPFIVSLQTTGGRHFCGGALLNANTVLTAGHCTIGQSAGSVQIRAGSLQRNSGGVTSRVSRLTLHPQYNDNTLNNDVAIWKLSSSIPAGGSISYATLAAAGSDPSSGTTLTVAGWGATVDGGSDSPVALRKVSVPVVSRATCRQQYSVSEITDNMFCAGFAQGGRDSCQGDSGGPIIDSSRTLVGVVSWGDGCALPGLSGVYARIGTTRSWINSQL